MYGPGPGMYGPGPGVYGPGARSSDDGRAPRRVPVAARAGAGGRGRQPASAEQALAAAGA
ncbi:hypothetical protein DEJ44_21125 [Streptomyces venezuelae]|nr:hypothetical protein DEJ44_21125 [Streptomyces venezuelae]